MFVQFNRKILEMEYVFINNRWNYNTNIEKTNVDISVRVAESLIFKTRG